MKETKSTSKPIPVVAKPIRDHVRARTITLTCNGSNRWKVDFEGLVTRRDILKINRILSVEFARAVRRYSKKRRQLLIDSNHETQLVKPTNKEVTTDGQATQ